MAKIKDFDCVEMKNRIQAELLERYEGMSEEEIRADQNRRIQNDPVLGPLFLRLTAGSENPVHPPKKNE